MDSSGGFFAGNLIRHDFECDDMRCDMIVGLPSELVGWYHVGAESYMHRRRYGQGTLFICGSNLQSIPYVILYTE